MSKTWKILNNKITNLCDEIESLKQHISALLTIPKGEYSIYSYDFGNELLNILNESPDIIEIKAFEYLNNLLLSDDRIISLSDFIFLREFDTFTIKFTVNSVFGQFESEANL